MISRMAKCYVCELLPQQRVIFCNLMQFLCFPSPLFCVLHIICRTEEDPSGYKLKDDEERTDEDCGFLSAKFKLTSSMLLPEKFSLGGNSLCGQLARQYMHKQEIRFYVFR